MKNFIVVFASLVVLSACTTGQSARTSSSIYSPTDSSKIEILFEKPARAHFVIGTVACKAHTFAADDAVLRSIQKEAAELGAHAVIFQGFGEVTGFDGGKLKNGRGLAIRWEDGNASAQSIAVTPTSTQATTPRETQVIPEGAGKK